MIGSIGRKMEADVKPFLAALATGAIVLAGQVSAQTQDAAADPMAHFMTVMDATMARMQAMTSTGNTDADFLMMMIPHHQSAIEIARYELENGTDQATRDLAQKMIDAQTAEIEEITRMLADMGFEAPPAE